MRERVIDFSFFVQGVVKMSDNVIVYVVRVSYACVTVLASISMRAHVVSRLDPSLFAEYIAVGLRAFNAFIVAVRVHVIKKVDLTAADIIATLAFFLLIALIFIELCPIELQFSIYCQFFFDSFAKAPGFLASMLLISGSLHWIHSNIVFDRRNLGLSMA